MLIIIIFPHLNNLIIYITSNGINSLFEYEIRQYIYRFFVIILNNLNFYASVISVIQAINIYFKQEKEKQKEILREKDKLKKEINNREQEKKEIKLKELEQYKDNFRPSFVLNPRGNKLLVLMKKNDLFIENVHYYPNEKSEGVFYKNLKHNSEIDLKQAKNNYFLVAETLIGEKIIFGVVLNNIKVYKYLRENGSPIIPNNFNFNDISEKINLNWGSFNRVNSFESIETKK